MGFAKVMSDFAVPRRGFSQVIVRGIRWQRGGSGEVVLGGNEGHKIVNRISIFCARVPSKPELVGAGVCITTYQADITSGCGIVSRLLDLVESRLAVVTNCMQQRAAGL